MLKPTPTTTVSRLAPMAPFARLPCMQGGACAGACTSPSHPLPASALGCMIDHLPCQLQRVPRSGNSPLQPTSYGSGFAWKARDATLAGLNLVCCRPSVDCQVGALGNTEATCLLPCQLGCETNEAPLIPYAPAILVCSLDFFGGPACIRPCNTHTFHPTLRSLSMSRGPHVRTCEACVQYSQPAPPLALTSTR